ncbi:lactate permease LctP family transporter [Sporolactobacillus sp. CPB3-1]|uniref:L-lactate permease n=1 Tax=Sporolactobacillus mangiferae TaxID=2940498 RepID=A0ABT0M6T2_9BACL|nr:lactate permease LctP family transporter [Sporolactobacillus mangiferae]MCL1630561.1 lactate permease LctP family transporter [Sporolactobacillus mangiferae]
MQWAQNYNPLGNMFLSFLVACIPLVFFFWSLAVKKMKGYQAGLLTVGVAILEAVLIYKMPIHLALEATALGGLQGLWPIGWIIVTAVFLYELTVASGKFQIISDSITSITQDRRLQALLIAFSFGAFLEGTAGYGTPVAIAGGLLAGLGFNPFYAAGLCLIANTAPVAFGGVGIPILTSGQVTGIDVFALSQMVGRQVPLLSLIVPFWLVLIMAGWKRTLEVLPAILVCGLSFSGTQFLTANFLGPELPDVASAIVSMAALVLFLKFWQPKTVFRFKDEEEQPSAASVQQQKTYTFGQITRAWSPFVLLVLVICVWGGSSSFKEWLGKATVMIPIPGLDQMIEQVRPIVTQPTPYGAIYKFDVLAATGTAILLTCILSKLLIGISWRRWWVTFWLTLKKLALPLVMIVSVLGFAYIENYSGMSATLGLGLASTGAIFPFVSPFIGWIGVFLTGSDTSSNALFSNLQHVSARQIGVDPTLLVAANSTGGVAAKMISPQSIAVATAATGLVGKEGNLFRFTLKHSLLLVSIIGIITLFQAYVFQWMIP